MKLKLSLLFLMTVLLFSACKKDTVKSEKEFAYFSEQFADIKILRYKVPGFENLSLKQKEFDSFSKYIWQFTNGKPILNAHGELKDIPATTLLSDAISKDLKKRGFKFVGSTVIYAHMQATGMVNDHLKTCFRYRDLSAKAK